MFILRVKLKFYFKVSSFNILLKSFIVSQDTVSVFIKMVKGSKNS